MFYPLRHAIFPRDAGEMTILKLIPWKGPFCPCRVGRMSQAVKDRGSLISVPLALRVLFDIPGPPKTRTRAHSPKPPFYRTTLSFCFLSMGCSRHRTGTRNHRNHFPETKRRTGTRRAVFQELNSAPVPYLSAKLCLTNWAPQAPEPRGDEILIFQPRDAEW